MAGSSEIHYFYAGTNTDHDGKVDGKTKQSGIGMCRGRLDGLVSLTSPLHPPSGNVSVAITKPIVVSGTNLALNVDTGAGGVIRVEVLNSTSSQPIPLFSDSVIDKGVFTVNHENTVPIVSNSVAKIVQWHTLIHLNGKHVRQQYGLEALHGQQVKFRFLMVGTKLYSYSLKTDDVEKGQPLRVPAHPRYPGSLYIEPNQGWFDPGNTYDFAYSALIGVYINQRRFEGSAYGPWEQVSPGGDNLLIYRY